MRGRPGFDLSQYLGWKRKVMNATGIAAEALWERILYVLLIASVMAAETVAWEEGNDAVNVISVENMDALLGLRMVTELKAFEGVKTNESENRFEEGGNVNETGESSETRYKRMVNLEWKVFPVSSHVYDLCSTDRCLCTTDFKNERVNITCDFQNEEIILIPGSIPPTAQEISLSNSGNLIVSSGTFSNHRQLERVVIRNVETLLISDSAFQNLSATFYFNLTIENCKNLLLEDYSFRNLNNPMTVTISNCHQVVFKKSVFYWFTDVRIENVPLLKLEENTFSSEVRHGVELLGVSLSFKNVTFYEIPNATFPLSSAKIAFLNCSIAIIRSGAFNGIALISVSFQSSRLKNIQEGAFSERTLVQFLEFDNTDIQFVDANVLSAAARLTIHNCRIEEITNGAFNISTAYFKLLNNYFLKIRRYAFEIHNWNSITIEGNHFNELEPEFFTAPFSNVTRITTEFKFSNNTLARVEIDVLSFLPNEHGLDSSVGDNIFENTCHCDLETWIRRRTGDSWESFYETSFCVISELLEKCYNVSQNYVNMKMYVEKFCRSEKVIICEDVHRTHHPNILIPLSSNDTERTVLGVIFLGLLSSVAIMVTILILFWLKTKSYCGSKRKSQTSNSECLSLCCSRLCNDGNLVKSDSISRMNIHEYAEIQNQINYQQKQTNLTIEEEPEEEETLECENKATQTIPEELTQELIQSLREKLDDPENYNEARDMIEHLYDLIKVEESCNNNYNRSLTNSFILDEEDEEIGGIYEVIKSTKLSSPTKSSKKRLKGGTPNVTSTGTRVPSPDKLSPITFNVIRPKPTMVGDYIEPKDRKSNEYCELPSAHLVMPDVLTSSQIKNETVLSKANAYAEPFQIVNMSGRPLPNKPIDPGIDPGPSQF